LSRYYFILKCHKAVNEKCNEFADARDPAEGQQTVDKCEGPACGKFKGEQTIN
jgi:hypothetical protein